MSISLYRLGPAMAYYKLKKGMRSLIFTLLKKVQKRKTLLVRSACLVVAASGGDDTAASLSAMSLFVHSVESLNDPIPQEIYTAGHYRLIKRRLLAVGAG